LEDEMKKYLLALIFVFIISVLIADLGTQIKWFVVDKKLKFWKWQGQRRKRAGIIVSASKA
jgi:hypothetical protein